VREALTKEKQWSAAVASLKPSSMLEKPEEWTDVSGLLTPRERLAALEDKVASGVCSSYDDLLAEFQAMYDSYLNDEWQYIYDVYSKECGILLSAVTREQLLAAADDWEKAASSLQGMVTEDSKKEFGAFARIGYGLDQTEENVQKDFEAVRGTIETNGVVQKLAAEGDAIRLRKEQFKNLLASTTA
jgi:hypothetical protein